MGKPGTTSPPTPPCAPVSETYNSEGQISLRLIPLHGAFYHLFHFQVLMKGMNRLDQWKPFDQCAEFIRKAPRLTPCQRYSHIPNKYLPPRHICYLHNAIHDHYLFCVALQQPFLGSIPFQNLCPPPSLGKFIPREQKLYTPDTKISCETIVISEIECIKE